MNNQLLLARLNANLTQATIAKMVNIPRESYIQIEKGRTIPRIDVAHRIADILQIDVKIFLPSKVRKSNIGEG